MWEKRRTYGNLGVKISIFSDEAVEMGPQLTESGCVQYPLVEKDNT